jgi:3-oxochol-4-en-24-oyl-CoA dehydrogenase
MELLLTEEQTLLRDTAARLAATKGGPRRARALRDAGTEIDRTAWNGMIEAGWLSALVAETDGGLGLGLFDLALAIDAAGKQIVMAPLIEVAAAIRAVTQTTADSHPARAEVLSNITIPATMPPGQSFGDVAPLTFDARSSMLSGTISFVPFAASADFFLADAGKGAGTVLCLVPRNAKGLSITTTPNVDGSTSSTLTFSQTVMEASNILTRGAAAQAALTAMHDMLILGTAAELLGVAQAANDMTVEYAKLRTQFGKPIGSFQALQHRMADCYVDAELNRSLFYQVASAWDAGTSHPAMISAVKARLGKGALKTVRTALQLHGAMGYTEEHDIGVYYKRAVTLAAKYGNELAHAGRFSELTLRRAAE